MSTISRILASITCTLFAASALAQSFTYQGELSLSGSPANAPHDFEFRLFSSPTGGAQVGGAILRPGTDVMNGLFTATIDPSPGVLDGQPRWLQVAVRPAGSNASFTVLSPRQAITPAPYAARSLSERWTDTGNSVLTSDPSVERVFINRSSPVTTAEYFGITAPVPNGGFGGMYINTSAPQGMPFYGYAVDGSARAYHYLDTQGTWALVNGVQSVMVSSAGNVGIGTSPATDTRVSVGGTVAASGSVVAGADVTATGDFLYSNLKTRRLAISGAGMQPQDAAGRAAIIIGVGSAYHLQTTAAHRLYANVPLPEGAKVVQMKMFAVDDSIPSVTAKLHEYVPSSSFSYVVAEVASTGAAPTVREFVTVVANAPTVDLTGRTWSLEVELPTLRTREFNSFNGVIIEYTVPGPD